MQHFRFYLLLVLIAFIVAPNTTLAQKVTGTIYSVTNGKRESVPGANIVWLGSTIGTSSDANGRFELQTRNISDKRLIVSYLGFKTDTITVKAGSLDIELKAQTETLGTVEVTGKQASAFISQLDPRKVQVITSNELKRAACCNLSESFETSASVDVMYSDAISGAKQIQLLGLSGVYSQIISENVPLLRGLGSTFGLGYIPGPWMESISVSKGASSVMNGFESTTGLINVEYKKPATSEKLYLNAFANQHGRVEANFNSGIRLNPRLSTMVLGHASTFQTPFNNNGDNFMDIPKLTTYNFINRWDYDVPGKYDSRLLVKYMDETRTGGFMDFDPETYNPSLERINNRTETYGFQVNTRRLESFWKNGVILKDHSSIALIVSGILHDQEGFFGFNTYSGIQKSMHGNLIYQGEIGHSEKHRFTTGLNLIYDNYNEHYIRRDFEYLYQHLGVSDQTDPLDTLFTVYSYRDTTYVLDRKEVVPGAYFEYTWLPAENLTVIAGIRLDHHNKQGYFTTPRIHVKYRILPETFLRASAGTGSRTANVFAENFSILASQRKIHFVESLNREKAWNYGINLTRDFKFLKRDAQIDLEAYRTDFVNQVIADLDSLPSDVFFYNLHGKSYASSYMAQLTFEPVKRLSVLAAFRVSDVKNTIKNQLKRKPMVSAYKGILSLNYATRFEKWKFDFTIQFNGKSRLPDTQKMPVLLQRAEYSPSYSQVFAQVTRKFKVWEAYLGVENLTNFIQKDPVTEDFAPYHTHFDTSMVWGPLVGRTLYAGIRYAIK